MNWIDYTVIAILTLLQFAQVYLDFILKYFFKDARTIKHRRYRTILLLVTIILLIIGVINNIKKEQKASREKKELGTQISNVNSNQENLDSSVTEGFQSLHSVLATNRSVDSTIRLAILDTDEREIVEQQDELAKKRELISVDVVDLKTLRAERENKRVQLELQQRQAEIERERNEVENQQTEIQNKQAQEQAQQAQQIENQKNHQEILRKEIALNHQCSAIFDYAVTTLFTMLFSISKDTGDKIFHDFATTPPSIYQSSLIAEDKIVDGTNSIRLGNNPAWNFEISTTKSVAIQNTNIVYRRMFQRRGFSHFTVTCQGKNGFSSLSIWPIISTNSYQTPFKDIKFDQVSVSINIPNESGLNNPVSYTNYPETINVALRALIESQDEKFPLKSIGDK